MHSLVSGETKWKISSSGLCGRLNLLPSKSQSVRALIFALLAENESVIECPLFSPDFDKLIKITEKLGAQVRILEDKLIVSGTSGEFNSTSKPLEIGNSGLAFRFLSALLALCPNSYQILGDESVKKRPLSPLLKVLEEGGACIQRDPLTIQGIFKGGDFAICGSDSQYTSALLIAAPFTKKGVSLTVHQLKERPYVEMTLNWLERLKLSYTREKDRFFVPGNQKISSFNYTVPGDLSTLAFPLVTALLTSSNLEIHGVDLSDSQADGILLSFLREMGASIEKKGHTLIVNGPQVLRGGHFCIKDCIDLFPILCVLGTKTQSPLHLTGYEGARFKECDRVSSMQKELTKMGGILKEEESSFTIYPSSLHGALLDSHGDHRIALALSVAAMTACSQSEIIGVCCAEKTFRGFRQTFQNLGACIS